MLASSAVISGLVICPVDIREVKISSYDYSHYLGGVFCDQYSLVRDSWRASRDWRWSFGGR